MEWRCEGVGLKGVKGWGSEQQLVHIVIGLLSLSFEYMYCICNTTLYIHVHVTIINTVHFVTVNLKVFS